MVLYVQLYLAFFVQGAILIHALYAPITQHELWMEVLIGCLGAVAALVSVLRLALQDWYVSFRSAERVFVTFIPALVCFLIPLPASDHHVWPEGFALVLPALLLMAVDPRLARRYLLATLLGFWIALIQWPGMEIGLVIAFGCSSLFSLGCLHFATVGAPFNLRGLWALRRIVQAVFLYSVPASLAAYLAWFAWPEPTPPVSGAQEALRPLTREDLRRVMEFSAAEWRDLSVKGSIAILLVMLSLIMLYYLRKYLHRRVPAGDLPKLLGADLSEITIESHERVARRRSIPGVRGQILRLWRQWSREHETRGVVRAASETAAELAERIGGEPAREASPRESLTRLFEQAHYGKNDLPPELVEKMKEWIKADLADEPEGK